jgi:hypothetical protein
MYKSYECWEQVSNTNQLTFKYGISIKLNQILTQKFSLFMYLFIVHET